MLTFENRCVKTLVSLASLIVRRDENWYAVSQWESVKRFEEVAKNLGFIKLGAGHFSQAWTHPLIQSYAIKLGFKKEDSGAAYAAFCRQYQGLEGIPEISDIKQISSGYVVIMKRYIPIVNSVDKRKVYKMSDVLCGMELEDAPLYGTLKLIRQFFTGIASFDLHGENVMKDEEGNLIITDPVSFKKAQSIDKTPANKVNNCKLSDFIRDVGNDFIKPANKAALLRELLDMRILIDDNFPKFEVIRKHKEPEINKAKKPHFLVARDERNGMKPRFKILNK